MKRKQISKDRSIYIEGKTLEELQAQIQDIIQSGTPPTARIDEIEQEYDYNSSYTTGNIIISWCEQESDEDFNKRKKTVAKMAVTKKKRLADKKKREAKEELELYHKLKIKYTKED